jgi:outer membrane receptor protein involved in Fe transport
MKFLLSVCLFLFTVAAGRASESTGIIKGRVYDSQTLESLPSASVVSGRGRGVVTDHDGHYILAAEAGEISLSFRFMGYKSVAISVLVIPGDTVVMDVGLDYDIAEIDQIVFSAGKVEQRLSELTVSVNIIKPEVYSASHITDPTELINKTSGMEVIDGQASIRGGSGFSYGAGSRVLALIDGLPVLSADAGHIKWQYLPLENISQIEIIKGASSVLYGSSALNGVINFRTARAGSEPVTRFYLESGVFGRPSQRNWIWWDSPRTFHSSSFSHIQRAGNADLSFGLHLLYDNGYRKLNDERLGRINFKVKYDDRKVGGLSYGVNLNAGLTSATNFILWENGWTGALKQDESTANRLNGNLITIDPFITLDRGRNRHDLRSRLQSSDNTYPTARQNNSNALSFLAEYQFRVVPSSILDLNFGIFENYSQIISEFYGNHNSLNIAAYTQADIKPVARLKIVAGVRFEYNSLNGITDRVIPLFRTGINYRILDYTFLRGSFGQGYRYPSIAEKHAATTIGSVRIVPNPFILPESGWNSEIGVKQGIITGTVNGQIDLAFFYTVNRDMIEYVFDIYPDIGQEGYSPGFKAFNIEHSRVYGGEFEFAFTRATGRFENSLTGGYVFMYPVEFSPQTGRNMEVYLKYRRKHSFKVNLGSEYNKFSGGFNVNVSSRILNIDNMFLHEFTRESILPGFYDYWIRSAGGHAVIDPYIGYAINERFKISLAVKNVFNTEYMGRPGDIMPHRNFSIRFSGHL